MERDEYLKLIEEFRFIPHFWKKNKALMNLMGYETYPEFKQQCYLYILVLYKNSEKIDRKGFFHYTYLGVYREFLKEKEHHETEGRQTYQSCNPIDDYQFEDYSADTFDKYDKAQVLQIAAEVAKELKNRKQVKDSRAS